MNLSVDYFLFRQKCSLGSRNSASLKMTEDYLIEYCSESLIRLSLQNSCWATLCFEHRNIFQDTEKQFINIKHLRITECNLGKELPFKKMFPNMETLKIAHNDFSDLTAIQIHLPTLKHLWFDVHSNYNSEFSKEDLEGFFQLNPQLESATLYYDFDLDLDYVKKYCPHVQIIGNFTTSPFSYCRYIWSPGSATAYFINGEYVYYPDIMYWEKHKLYPSHVSAEYRNALISLYKRYIDISFS